MKTQLLTAICLFIALTVQGKDVNLTSPDGRLSVVITDREGELSYTTSLDGEPVFTQTALQMRLQGKTIGQQAKINSASVTQKREIIRPAFPIKQGEIKNDYTSAILRMKDGYSVEFRLFDNAVAYRYVLSEKDSVYVIDETFNLRPARQMTVHYQPTESWGTASESHYVNCMLTEWEKDKEMAVLPVCLSSADNSLQLLVSESDLRDYPGMYLRGCGDENALSCCLVPYYQQWEVYANRWSKIIELAPWAAHTSGNRSFPWRYVVVGDEKTLIEQTITAQLAGECELDDVSWIEPGQVSWDWWNDKGIYGSDVNFKPGCNTDTYKYYIDFASKYGIKYIIMDEGWATSIADPYTPNKNLDLHEVIAYGKERGVGVILWLTAICVERNLSTIFATYEEWGVAGTKIDFMDRQDQWMINWYERTIKEAAKHHIVVDFHGAMKPAGLEHRYPNLLAYEAVCGLEAMSGCYPDNTLYIPFIRNAVGAADFTPGAMFNTQPEFGCPGSPNCAAIGTRAYSMALFTILETGTQMLADSPTQYYRNPDCIDFLTQVPVTWDETRALEASIGEYLIVAKRKGDKWFVAGICNGQQDEREFSLPLDFLSAGTHNMRIVTDGYNAGFQAMDYRMDAANVTPDTVLDIRMVRNGGFTAIID